MKSKFQKRREPKIGANQQKVLLLLSAGLGLAFAHSPLKARWILKSAAKEWEAINQRALRVSIAKLYKSKLISQQYHPDDSVTFVLSREGERRVLEYSIDTLAIKRPKVWDKKWRIVLFDVPEDMRRVRDAVRHQLKRLGFFEFQKSVFVHPYECTNEVDFVIELFQARRFVRFIEAISLDNELHLKKHFGLLA